MDIRKGNTSIRHGLFNKAKCSLVTHGSQAEIIYLGILNKFVKTQHSPDGLHKCI